jgi:hypothetical protein
MCSTASGWKNGQRIWHVDHDSETSVENLTATGELPAEFAGIHRELQAQQDAEGPDGCVDYIFDVPVKLTEALTGYNYAENSGDWHLLVPASTPSLWGRLFKR